MERTRLIFLYLYLFGLSIENWSPGGTKTDLLRPTLIFAMLYVIFSLFDIRKNFKVFKNKQYLQPALFIWFWISLISLFYYGLHNTNFSFNYTLLACIISFWILLNDLNRYHFLKNHFLIIILINGIFLSLLSYFEIGIDYGHLERQSLLGNNANIIGLSAVISILIIIFYLIENPLKLSKGRFFLLIAVPLLLQTIAKTGSKGALITLAMSVFSYLLLLNIHRTKKIISLIFGIGLFIISFQYMLENEVLAFRWNQFIVEGDTTGRSRMWKFALDTFLENPFLGIGENGLGHKAFSLFGGYDPHNVYLYVMATGGIVATIPLLIFLVRIFLQTYKNSKIWKTNFYLIIFIVILFFWFKAGGGINSKLVWAYFALLAFHPSEKNRSYNPKELV